MDIFTLQPKALAAKRLKTKKMADDTAVPGMKKLFHSQSILGRTFWIILLLFAAFMCTWQIIIISVRFFSNPTTFVENVQQGAAKFPDVTLCNMRHLDDVTLDHLNRRLSEWDISASEKLTKRDAPSLLEPVLKSLVRHRNFPLRPGERPFIQDYIKMLGSGFLTYIKHLEYLDKKDKDLMIKTLFSRQIITANIPDGIATTAGTNYINEFIASCTFNGEKCDLKKDFKHFFDPYYFSCYTFSPKNATAVVSGPDSGLSLTVFSGSAKPQTKVFQQNNHWILPGINELGYELSNREGIRLLVHRKGSNRDLFNHGFDLRPGVFHSLRASARAVKRMCPGSKGKTNESIRDTVAGEPIAECLARCAQRTINKRCKCVDSKLPVPKALEKVAFCEKLVAIPGYCDTNRTDQCVRIAHSWFRKLECLRTVKAELAKTQQLEEKCDCKKPCSETEYSLSERGVGNWPGQGDRHTAFYEIFTKECFLKNLYHDEEVLLRQKYNMDGTIPEHCPVPRPQYNYHYLSDDFLKVNIHLSSPDVTELVEKCAYTWTEYFSDVGGQLALWLGLSLITMVELLQILGYLFHYCATKMPRVKDEYLPAGSRNDSFLNEPV